MWLIGQEWKYSNVCSGLILIGRGLDLNLIWVNSEMLLSSSSLFSFEGAEKTPTRKKLRNAPLAQLVEQLTLNQWVLGSNPRWCTTFFWTPVKRCVEMARWSSG